MVDLSDAEIHYSKLSTDRARQVQQLATDVAAFPNLAARLQPVVDHVAASADGYDFWNEYLRRPHADPMVATLKTMKIGDGSHDLDDLIFGAWASDEAMAEMSPMPDGSGLVLVSDALLSICVHLSMVNALWFDSTLGKNTLVQLAKMSHAVRQGAQGKLSLIGGAVIRYHLLHLRVHGLPAKLTPVLTENGTRMAEMMSLYAIRFICAHEAAHYLLGHATDPVGMLSAEHLPLIKNSQELEYEADEVAARAVALTNKGEGWPDPPIAAAGVMLAIAAISVLEHGTFVRRVRTHPPANMRWQRISHLLDTTNVNNLLRGMSLAIEVGGDPAKLLPPTAWDLMSSEPEVMRDGHDSEYLEVHGKLDAMLTLPTHVLVSGLARLNPTGGDLASGLEQARQRNITGALRAWGVPARRAAQLVERQGNLGFYSTVETLLRSDAVTRLPNSTEQRSTAAALTTILTKEERW